MGLAQKVKRYTPQEYYRLERDAQTKHEYFDGEIFAMAGGSVNHGRICSSILRAIGNRLEGSPCEAFTSDLRLQVKATGLRTYPDVSVYCGPLESDPEDSTGQTVTNPTVLFEVLSKTTESYDRKSKANNYRKIESLKALVLVSQAGAQIELYERQANGTWTVQDIEGLDAKLAIPCLNVTVPLSDIYARVDFNATE
jgi:Uma2 family endonuclease